MASSEWWDNEGRKGSRWDLTVIPEESACCWKACNLVSVVRSHAASSSGLFFRWTRDGYCILLVNQT
jgi:hypothetical protein